MADTTVLLGGNPVKLVDNGDGTFSLGAIPLSTGAATSAKQDTLIGHVDGLETALTTLNAKDFATQTTLAEVLAKIITAPATEAKQDTLIAKDFATQTTLAAVLAKIISAPATEAKQDTLIAKDFATQTTLAAILAKIIAAPATEATLASVQATLAQGGIPATTLETTHQNAATTNGNGTAATVSGYGPIAFQATGTFDGATITYKGSVDGTNYEALPGTSAVTTTGISKFDVSGYKSVLAVISGAGASTSLTVKSLAVGVARPLSSDVITVGKAADNAAASGNPVLLAGRYSTTPATRDNGDAVTLETDATGSLLTKLTGSIPSGTATIGSVLRPYLEEYIINDPSPAKVTVINGATYNSADKNVAGYGYVSAGFYLTSNTAGNVTLRIIHKMPASWANDATTVAAGVREARVEAKQIRSSICRFDIQNSSGADIEVTKLGYFAQ